MVHPEGRVLYILNPSKVPKSLEKYMYSVEGSKKGGHPDYVVYHSHQSTFERIVNKLRKSGVHLQTPLYGYMLGGKFYP